MHRHRECQAIPILLIALVVGGINVAAQEPKPTEVHEHVAVTAEALTPTRETTGTSWLPAASPMYGLHQPWRGWDLRVNGAAFLEFIIEPGDRHRTGGADTDQVAGLNWGMFTARRPVGEARFGVRAMLSAEPATVRACGALSFLATGDACDGDTIHDRQQAHDLVMELAADYDRPLAGQWRWQIYGGLAGAPAFGPPAYAHRPSAIANPLRPISHHWLDSTSTAFGVVTLGAFNQRWKYEASAFNGRDGDESRVDMDFGAFDSFSARVSVLPTNDLALQLSAASVKEPSSIFPPTQAATKVSASALFQRRLGSGAEWSTTLAFGFNRGEEFVNGVPFEISSNAAVLESSLTMKGHTVFGRAERVAMPAHHLHAHEFFESVFPVGKVQAGYTRSLGNLKGLVPGVGASVALSLLPEAYAPRYSGAVAPSFHIFVNLLPARHVM